jgi:hypothetical protein
MFTECELGLWRVRYGNVKGNESVLLLLLLFIYLYLHVIILSGLLHCNNVSIIHCAQYNVNVWRLCITMVTVGMQGKASQLCLNILVNKTNVS